MDRAIVVRGRYRTGAFVPDGPLPDAEGTAELIIIPSAPVPPRTGSVADAFGSAPRLRTGEDIAAQIREERESWGER